MVVHLGPVTAKNASIQYKKDDLLQRLYVQLLLPPFLAVANQKELRRQLGDIDDDSITALQNVWIKYTQAVLKNLDPQDASSELLNDEQYLRSLRTQVQDQWNDAVGEAAEILLDWHK